MECCFQIKKYNRIKLECIIFTDRVLVKKHKYIIKGDSKYVYLHAEFSCAKKSKRTGISKYYISRWMLSLKFLYDLHF